MAINWETLTMSLSWLYIYTNWKSKHIFPWMLTFEIISHNNRHDDVSKSKGKIFRLLALCEGNPPDKGQWRRALINVFFELFLNKRLSKQLRRRLFETPSRSLWWDRTSGSRARLGAGVGGFWWKIGGCRGQMVGRGKYLNFGQAAPDKKGCGMGEGGGGKIGRGYWGWTPVVRVQTTPTHTTPTHTPSPCPPPHYGFSVTDNSIPWAWSVTNLRTFAQILTMIGEFYGLCQSAIEFINWTQVINNNLNTSHVCLCKQALTGSLTNTRVRFTCKWLDIISYK